MNDERFVNDRWTNGERTLNERKNGKVERFRDMYVGRNARNKQI